MKSSYLRSFKRLSIVYILLACILTLFSLVTVASVSALSKPPLYVDVGSNASSSDQATASLLVNRIDAILQEKGFTQTQKRAVRNAIHDLSHDRLREAAPQYEDAMVFALLLMHINDTNILFREGSDAHGGSGESLSANSKEPQETTTSSSSTTAQASSWEETATMSAQSLSQQEISQAMLYVVNQERADQGLDPFVMNDVLFAMAQGHAEQMSETGRFDHEDVQGRSVADRAQDAGYVYMSLGENIAWNQNSVAEVMKAWMNSSGHRANILESRFTQLGVGYKNGYWVQVFGTPR